MVFKEKISLFFLNFPSNGTLDSRGTNEPVTKLKMYELHGVPFKTLKKCTVKPSLNICTNNDNIIVSEALFIK